MVTNRVGVLAVLLTWSVIQLTTALADTPSPKLTAEERARQLWTAIKLEKLKSFPRDDGDSEVPLQFPDDLHVPFKSVSATSEGICLSSDDNTCAFIEAPLPDLAKVYAAKNLNQLLGALLPGRYDTKAARDFVRGTAANDASLATSAPIGTSFSVVYAHGGRLIGLHFHMTYYGSYDPPFVKHTADTPFLDFWTTQWTSSDIDAKYKRLDEIQKAQKVRP